MQSKTANVTARIQPEIKKQAEEVLKKIGIPVSVLIDSLYRQIIMTNGIPYPLTVPAPLTLDEMSEQQFNAVMKQGLFQAKAGQGSDAEKVFADIEESI